MGKTYQDRHQLLAWCSLQSTEMEVDIYDIICIMTISIPMSNACMRCMLDMTPRT